MKPQDKVFMAVGGSVLALAATATGLYLFTAKDSTTPTQTTAMANTSQTTDTSSSSSGTSSPDSSTSTSTSTSSTSYKDGTYSATTSYYVPHGANNLTAKVTINGGTITAVSVTHDYSDGESGMYIDSFENALQSTIVGKQIDGLSVSRIGGASLTTEAFQTALTKIIDDAKS